MLPLVVACGVEGEVCDDLAGGLLWEQVTVLGRPRGKHRGVSQGIGAVHLRIRCQMQGIRRSRTRPRVFRSDRLYGRAVLRRQTTAAGTDALIALFLTLGSVSTPILSPVYTAGEGIAKPPARRTDLAEPWRPHTEWCGAVIHVMEWIRLIVC